MAFIPDKNFNYDIFISYTHIDNETTGQSQQGWVDDFYEQLSLKLKKVVGKSVSIWRDVRRIDPAQAFGDEVNKALRESAILLSLTSRNSLFESPYCEQERQDFYAKIQNDSYGTKINSHNRVINVLLYNIPYQQWPKEYGLVEDASTGFKFYEPIPGDTEDSLGMSLKPGSEAFEQNLNLLVSSLNRLLVAFKMKALASKTVTEQETPAPEGSFKIYFAEVSDTLSKLRKKTITGLQELDGIHIATKLPSYYSAAEHETVAKDLLKSVDLSIHLLNEFPGIPIDEEPGYSYPFKQAELSLQTAKSQFIWVPQSFKINEIDEDEQKYRTFLANLESDPPKSPDFVYCKSLKSDLLELIQKRVEVLKAPQRKSDKASVKPGVLLDCHIHDEAPTYDLAEILEQAGLQTRVFTQKEKEPESKLKYYERVLGDFNKLMIYFGNVNCYWVIERLKIVQKSVIKNDYPLNNCTIYLAPPQKSIEDVKLIFQHIQEPDFKQRKLHLDMIDNSADFNPKKLKPILQ